MVIGSPGAENLSAGRGDRPENRGGRSAPIPLRPIVGARLRGPEGLRRTRAAALATERASLHLAFDALKHKGMDPPVFLALHDDPHLMLSVNERYLMMVK